MNILDIDATAALDLIDTAKISAVELLKELISHVNMNDRHLNAVIVKDFDAASQAAAAVDKQLRKDSKAALLGLPVTIKESFDVKRLPTTWGVRLKEDPIARSSAVVVERVEQEGAIVIGKTNVPTFLDGFSSSNEVYGRTLNPLDLSASPGGSSSGSAVAVRAGFSYLDIASDLSGSIRHPAAFCGVFGHCPSLGLVPSRGHSLFGRVAPFDMSTPGPIARSARDLLLALNVLAGPDADVASALAARRLSARHTRLADFRVLVLDQHPLLPTDTEAASAVVEFARRLATKGAKVVDGSKKVPSLTLSTMNYMRLLGATLSTGQNTEARANFVALDAELSGDRTMRGNFVRGSMFSHSEWIEAQETRIALRWQWNQLFEEYDAVICPVVPVTHLTHAQLDRGEVAVNGQTVTIDDLIVWAALSKSADLPATVVPFTESRDGYPIGVQIIAPFMEDATSIGLAILAGQQDISPAYAKIIHPPYLERGAHTRA